MLKFHQSLSRRLAASLALVSVAGMPGSAALAEDFNQLWSQNYWAYFGRNNVNNALINRSQSDQQQYYYSPIIGRFTIGPDKNLEGMNPVEALMRDSFAPKGDPSILSNINGVSGAVLPIDINRAIVDEGMYNAAPPAFRQPAGVAPWFSTPDEKLCQAQFQSAWTLTASVIAPEVEVFNVRLPNEKFTTSTIIVGSTKPDFNVQIPTSLGQVCLTSGAKALVSRSWDSVRVLNLTGKKESVLFRFHNGKVIAFGPGHELVAMRENNRSLLSPPDSIARRTSRSVFNIGDAFCGVNEFAPATVLKAAGLMPYLSAKQDSPEKRLCASVMKSAAVLAHMRGLHGFTRESEAVATKKLGQGLPPHVLISHKSTPPVAERQDKAAETPNRFSLKSVKKLGGSIGGKLMASLPKRKVAQAAPAESPAK